MWGREEGAGGHLWWWRGGAAAVRWGWHWRTMAVEIGPGLLYREREPGLDLGAGEDRTLKPIPSFKLRLGPPGLHFWTGTGALPGGLVTNWGVGHASERIRLNLGVGFTDALPPPGWLLLNADVAVAVVPNVWLGLTGRYGGSDSSSVKALQGSLSLAF